jgi:16S rRNA (uracil1498-N3)-methyltransferase
VASGAAEQCGRAVVPHIGPTTTLEGLMERPVDGARAVLLETPGHQSLASLPVDPTSPLLLLVGPAGGFEPAEAKALLAAGFSAASLGPRILRAETAGVAAVTIAQATWGDLGR